MQTLTVELGARSYPIHIGPDLLDQADLYRSHIRGRQVLIVSNETVAPLYLQRVEAALSDFAPDTIVLPDGEAYKTLETMEQIVDRLLERRHARTTTLIALGGGVVGDITGFAAACYQRGVAFIQIPTTLLAQVDSSVGGKTGVNHARGKNMIGAFHQPRLVLADTQTLNTLDDRQLSAGLAEVIKYGLIQDPVFFTWLEQNMARLRAREPEALIYAIQRSCEVKAEVVAADELEAGQRALLNLGHTFGHAIEAGAGYGNWLHGEAVAAGTCMAADLSKRLGWIDATTEARIQALFEAAGLPVQGPEGLTVAQYRDYMAIDKKVVDGRLRLVLLEDIGRAVVSDAFTPQQLDQTLAAFVR